MKTYITYDKVHQIIANKSNEIQEFNPDLIIGIAGGGLIPSRITRTFIKKPLLGIGVQLYNEKDELNSEIKKSQWFDEKNLEKIKGKRILLVDEIDDTRTTLKYCVDELWKCGVSDIMVFVLLNKKKEKRAKELGKCEYIAGEEIDDLWVVFPWDALDIDEHNKKAEQK
eukprot:gene3300-5741_t